MAKANWWSQSVSCRHIKMKSKQYWWSLHESCYQSKINWGANPHPVARIKKLNQIQAGGVYTNPVAGQFPKRVKSK
jgi:hypothetical protein